MGEPWEPAWLCTGEKALECRGSYGKVGRGKALGLKLHERVVGSKGVKLMRRLEDEGVVEFPE